MSKNNNSKYWAIILGASSGFGEATAVKLSADGYNIIGVHLDRQATMHNVEKIISRINKNGSEALFFNVNAADRFKRSEIVSQIKKKLNGEALIKVTMHSLAFGTLRSFIPNEQEQAITHAQMEMTLDVMAHSLVYWMQELYLNNLLAERGRVLQ